MANTHSKRMTLLALKSTFIAIIVASMIMIFYVLFIAVSAMVFVEVWVFEKILVPSILVVIAFLFLAWYGFGRNSIVASIFCSIFFISLTVLIPVMKYPNSIGVYGPWDSLAHYSFSEWIALYGRIPQNDELYYSSQYGFHPGNGLLPATLFLMSSIPLGWSMNIVLLASYITYVALFYIIVKYLAVYSIFTKSSVNKSMNAFLLLMAIFSLMLFPPYYGGVELSYAFSAFIVYLIVTMFYLRPMQHASTLFGKSLTFLIVFIGLLLTHYSTATIIILLTGLLMMYFLVQHFRGRSVYGFHILLSIIVIYMLHEIFSDVILYSQTVEGALRRLISLYIWELEQYKKATETHAYLSLFDLIRYLLASYTKAVVLFVLAVLEILLWLFSLKFARLKISNSVPKYLILLQLFTLLTWFAGYLGVGSFLSGGRCLMILQIFIGLNALGILLSVSSLKEHVRDFTASRSSRVRAFLQYLIAIAIIVFGVLSNHGLYILNQTLKYHEESYFLTGTGVVNDFPLEAMHFVNNYGSNGVVFLSIQPYITFGYSDLLWNISKMPKHGFILAGDFPEDAVERINSLMESKTNTIIPMPTVDNIVAGGKLGLRSYYIKPFETLSQKAALIYNNKYYTLFISYT